ncbi:MAG: zinc-binding alcohol dehydrogenase [Lachnospiraceae bacterium]|nr:zinc-binding alcohol dehydrogenase [Lachnospiraceae bacterium]
MVKETKIIRFHDSFDCRLDTIELQAPKDDELQCKSLYSVISIGTECGQFEKKFHESGHRIAEMGHPTATGYSTVAEVVEVGKDITDYKVGDIVFCHERHQSYFNIDTSWRVYHMPKWMEPKEVCWTVILRGGMFAAMKCQIQPTDTVVVMGCGIFGMASIMFAKMLGARNIVAIDPLKERAERAYQFGASHVLVGETGDVVEEFLKLNDGKYADSAIDCTAVPAGLAQACNIVRNDGNIALLTDPPMLCEQAISSNILLRYQHIHGIFIDMTALEPNAFGVSLQETHERIYEAFKSGDVHTLDMITHIVSPLDCQKIYSDIYADKSKYLGVLFDWSLIE